MIATLLNAGESDLAGLQAISGVTELSSCEHTEKVERSLFGAMMNNIFEVHLNTTGMSDTEINTAINQQLASQGFSGNVQITRGEDGQQLDVIVDDADMENLAGENGQIFIALDEDETVDGGGQRKQRVHMKMGNDPLAIDGTMSNEEIRAGILEQLKADGIDPANASITISRTPGEDGAADKVEVGVQVEENN